MGFKVNKYPTGHDGDPLIIFAQQREQIAHELAILFHTLGIPEKFFPRTVHYRFRGSTYTFDLEVLNVLNAYNCPVSCREVYEIHTSYAALNLVEDAVLLPCLKDGVPDLFRAQQKSAADLIDLYYGAMEEYRRTMNTIMEILEDYRHGVRYDNEQLIEAFFPNTDILFTHYS